MLPASPRRTRRVSRSTLLAALLAAGTLKHGEIKNLDMPPMSMVFRVREAKMLDGVAVGDRVRFVAEKVNGQYLLTTLTKAP